MSRAEAERRDRVGRGSVLLGVAVAGSLGVLLLVGAAFSIVTLGPSLQTCEADCIGEGDLALVVLVLGVLVAYVLLLAQMLRGVTAALGCGGLIGLLVAVVGVGFVAAKGAEAASDVVVVLVVLAAGGFALALGSLLRLWARRVPPSAKQSHP